jgi:hypothetical protein
MHQFNYSAPFERLDLSDFYTIPNQEGQNVADTAVANLFFHFGVRRVLLSYEGRNFESKSYRT